MTTPESSTAGNFNSVPNSVPITSSELDAQMNPFTLHHSIIPTTNLVSTPLAGSKGSLLSAWRCNNDVIASWIINSISKEIAASLVYGGIVKEIWDDLKERYRQSNGPHIYRLRKDLVTTTQGNLPVEVYYAKITTIWQELVEYQWMNALVKDQRR
ncbi:Retrovirus-related Pol polyprotein from transposon TNT 1-94 [Cucumis melo var. makuwa]|uniref:Retrovirus-related Pol polyprotein from transposon TNT 1-94 n=1 Tax=Cucumis melo var. makuwa TaxID=1194695 RepID=A0A5A7T2X0_CUCMM|nr:Retrovirus-related Pol polyprotein from transposon TNT 1-94 [Cucumis melo var. makuwa]TYK30816.1 Retrovirus-related Pol polyprotein from transposon TNT 1-94 [Cucumis melo var. makuwa]